MHKRKPSNLGQTRLRARQRRGDPMQAYDALPGPLRHWLAQAALPWSPTSAKRIWNRAQAQGLSVDVALQSLAQAEIRTLARDAQAQNRTMNCQP